MEPPDPASDCETSMSDLDQNTPRETIPQEHTSSRWWLVAALIATAIAAVMAVVTLDGLIRWEADGPGTVATEPIDGASTLTIAVARTPGGPGEWTNWARVIKNLSEELQRPVSVRYLSKEDEAAAVIAEEDIDIAFICAHHYVDLSAADEVVGLCTPVMGGSTTSHMWLITRADDPAESFEDLAGSIIGASDKSSLGGYAYLSYLAQERDVETMEFFSEVRLGDSQEANMHDLLAGDIRATVVNSAQVLSWDMSQFKVIEESLPIGCPPVVADEDMPAELRERIIQVLLAMDATSILEEGSGIDGFEAIDDAEYAFARDLSNACGHHDHP